MLNGGAVVRIGSAETGAPKPWPKGITKTLTVEPVVLCPRPNGLAVNSEDGSLWIADSGRRAILRAVPGTRPEVVEPGPFLGPNDLVFAADGTLFFTDPGESSAENPVGAVYRRSPQGGVQQLAGGLAYPNGLAVAPGGDALVVAETCRHRLIRVDLETGAVSPFCSVGLGPDGMAWGPGGLLYVALYREGCVAVVEARGGVTDKLSVLDPHPTNCTVNGCWLYVTLAASGRIQRLPLGGSRCEGQ